MEPQGPNTSQCQGNLPPRGTFPCTLGVLIAQELLPTRSLFFRNTCSRPTITAARRTKVRGKCILGRLNGAGRVLDFCDPVYKKGDWVLLATFTPLKSTHTHVARNSNQMPARSLRKPAVLEVA